MLVTKPGGDAIRWFNTTGLDYGDIFKKAISAVKNDPVYSNNVVNGYWISSNTTNPTVQEYHQKYISLEQHRRRTKLYIEHAKLLLDLKQISYKFMLTVDGDYLDTYDDNWICHEPKKGMVFANGSDTNNWGWSAVKSVPVKEEEKTKYPIPHQPGKFYEYRMDMSTIKNFPEREYMEALSYIGVLPE